MYYTAFETDLCGFILLGDEAGISRLHMVVEEEGTRQLLIPEDYSRNDALFEDAKQQLIEYVKGERKEFNLKLNPQGTDFQKKCWQALCDIPYGETRTYKEIAIQVGNEKASRAVGMANNKNPIPVIIPCHRVIGANGKLTGFAFGLGIKERMIALENHNRIKG